MSRFLTARILAVIPVLFVISLLAFGLEAITPGDPAILLLQASGVETITPEGIQAKRTELHLDDSLPVRYVNWLAGAVHGDFGRSFRSYEPVTKLYRDRFGATALLALCAAACGALIAIPLGTVAAYRRGGVLDTIAQLLAVIGSAVPGFWVALIAIYFLAARLHWLPVFGTLTPRGILMPVGVLTLAHTATLTRLTRSAVLDTLSQPYVTVARSKGYCHVKFLLNETSPHRASSGRR